MAEECDEQYRLRSAGGAGCREGQDCFWKKSDGPAGVEICVADEKPGEEFQ